MISHLIHRHYNVSGLCQFGCNQIEDLDHLFLLCPLSRATWFSCPFTIRTDHIHPKSISFWLKSVLGNVTRAADGYQYFIKWIVIISWNIYKFRTFASLNVSQYVHRAFLMRLIGRQLFLFRNRLIVGVVYQRSGGFLNILQKTVLVVLHESSAVGGSLKQSCILKVFFYKYSIFLLNFHTGIIFFFNI